MEVQISTATEMKQGKKEEEKKEQKLKTIFNFLVSHHNTVLCYVPYSLIVSEILRRTFLVPAQTFLTKIERHER